MKQKYETLINVLDRLRFEAPREYKKYRPQLDDEEKINQARSRALIHLYMKVSFGLLDFHERERQITDGSNDGGVDAYIIDQEEKKVIFVQSKFRTNPNNYSNKSISMSELLKMDVDRIVDGDTDSEDGAPYNGKIKQLVRDLSDISDIGRYAYEVVLIANIDSCKQSELKKLSGGFPVTVVDHKAVYENLLFPVVTGTYYNNSELCIQISLDGKTSSSARISYNVKTEYKDCDITVVFVPTSEVGRILHKYRNSILTFNPRCYLELQTNSVNKDIYDTICSKKTNEFALFNNGITMLSDNTSFNEHIGKKGQAQIVIESPQIINGGQTAYTLSRIYEDLVNEKAASDVFENKEVLLKIITFGESSSLSDLTK